MQLEAKFWQVSIRPSPDELKPRLAKRLKSFKANVVQLSKSLSLDLYLLASLA